MARFHAAAPQQLEGQQPSPEPMAAPALDPYALLGRTPDSSPAEVRRAYLDLARLVHPDKGGCARDMATLRSAYEFVRDEVVEAAGRSGRTVEQLEEEFAAFCADQLERPVPRYASLCAGCGGEGDSGREREAAAWNAAFEAFGGVRMPASAPGGYAQARSDDEPLPPLRLAVVPYREPAPFWGLACPHATGIQDHDPDQDPDPDYSRLPGACDYRAAYNETPERVPEVAEAAPPPQGWDPARLVEERAALARAWSACIPPTVSLPAGQ